MLDSWMINKKHIFLGAFTEFLRHVCPSVCMKQLVSHCTDFHEILHLNIFPKSVQKI